MSYNPYQKYSSYWWKYWWNLPYDLVFFLKRLRLYAPLLWEDRDFDYAYLLRLIKFKLQLMRPVIENGVAAHAHQKAIEIHQAEVMIDNIYEDPDDELSLHYDQWHRNTEFNEPCRQSDEECHKAVTASLERNERNWRILWDHLRDKMQGWWD